MICDLDLTRVDGSAEESARAAAQTVASWLGAPSCRGGAPAAHARQLAAALVDGLQDLEGQERTKACVARRLEALEAIQQVQCVLGQTEQSLQQDAQGGMLDEDALYAYSERLVWAADVLEGMRRGFGALQCIEPQGQEYPVILQMLSECEDHKALLACCIAEPDLLPIPKASSVKDAIVEPQRLYVEELDKAVAAVAEESFRIPMAESDLPATGACNRFTRDKSMVLDDFCADEMQSLLQSFEATLSPFMKLRELLNPEQSKPALLEDLLPALKAAPGMDTAVRLDAAEVAKAVAAVAEESLRVPMAKSDAPVKGACNTFTRDKSMVLNDFCANAVQSALVSFVSALGPFMKLRELLNPAQSKPDFIEALHHKKLTEGC